MAASIPINKIILPDRKQWKEDFLKSEVFDKLEQISIALRVAKPFRIINWDLEEPKVGLNKHLGGYTPRETYMYFGRLSLGSFYMIDYIVKNTKEYPIIDIGCGMNLFKSVYPLSIIGLDDDPRADIQGFFDEKFMEANREKFSAAIAINSLHFIHLNQIQYRIEQFSHIIQPNGLGYITFNTDRLIEVTNEVDPEFVISNKLDCILNLRKYILAKVYSICDTLELLYYEDNVDRGENSTDGNIKIMFRKNCE